MNKRLINSLPRARDRRIPRRQINFMSNQSVTINCRTLVISYKHINCRCHPANIEGRHFARDDETNASRTGWSIATRMRCR